MSSPRKKSPTASEPQVRAYDINVTGRKITQSWWGRAWQKTIESYSDYSNRLPRARSYLRGGRVKELLIQPGLVTAKVKGSRRTPYRVEIGIQPLTEEERQVIKELFSEQIDSVEEILEGKFPAHLETELLSGKYPLFPKPEQIEFACSCPDWAYLCKHVGSVLYGIGVVFDHDPNLFFTLRGLETSELIQRGIDQRLETYMERAQQKSPRVIADDAVRGLFGDQL